MTAAPTCVHRVLEEKSKKKRVSGGGGGGLLIVGAVQHICLGCCALSKTRLGKDTVLIVIEPHRDLEKWKEGGTSDHPGDGCG